MSYEIKWEKNGVLVRFSGLFDYDTKIKASNEIYSSKLSGKLSYIIWDTSGISEAFFTGQELSGIATYDQIASLRLPRLKMAMFANDKELHHLCEQYFAQHQCQLTGWNYLVSDNMDNIREWTSSRYSENDSKIDN